MVKLLIFILLSTTIMNKTYAASNNLFFTGAQLLTYCKSDNLSSNDEENTSVLVKKTFNPKQIG